MLTYLATPSSDARLEHLAFEPKWAVPELEEVLKGGQSQTHLAEVRLSEHTCVPPEDCEDQLDVRARFTWRLSM